MDETTYVNEVRIITDGGELTRFTEHGADDTAAWADFSEAIPSLKDGEIAQLIVDGVIAAEHNPEWDGHTVGDPSDY